MNPTQKIAEVYKQMLLDEAKKKMDPVGQADADIDNDGDVDDSDEYLHNRRKAIKKDMKEEQTECPECKGDGCDHCDDKGYHEALEIDPDDGETKQSKGDDKKKKKDAEAETSVEEAKKPAGRKLSAKDIKRALQSPANKAKPKDKVSLKKAPWESVNEVEEPSTDLGKKFKNMHKVEVDDTEEKGHMDAVKANKAGPKAKQPKRVKDLRK